MNNKLEALYQKIIDSKQIRSNSTLLLKSLKQIINMKPKYEQFIDIIIKFQKQLISYKQLLKNENQLIDLLAQYQKYEDLSYLVAIYLSADSPFKLLKKQIQNKFTPGFYQLIKEQRELQTEALNKNLSKQLYTKINNMLRLIIKFNIQIKLKIYFKWITFIQGNTIQQIQLIKKLIQLVKQKYKPISDQHFQYFIELFDSKLLGKSNISLIINSFDQTPQQIALLFLKNVNQTKICDYLIILTKDCVPQKIWVIIQCIILALHKNNKQEVLDDIIKNYFKNFLLKLLQKSVYYLQIQKVINSMIKVQLKNFYLDQQQFEQYNRFLNKSHKLKHQKVLNKLFDNFKIYLEQPKQISNICQNSYISIQNNIQITQLSTSQFGDQQIIFESQDFLGIPNFGNTCYINSFLQNLFYSPSFREIIQNSTEDNNEVLILLKKIFKNLKIKNKNNKQMQQLKINILNLKGISLNFQNDYQHDCMDFGQTLIDKLLINKNRHIISKILEIKSTESFLCSQDHIISQKEINFSNLILNFLDRKICSQIKNVQRTSIDKLIDVYFESGRRQGKFKCEKCKVELQEIKVKNEINYFPKLLIISLSRFRYDKNEKKKIKIFDKIQISDYINIKQIKSINQNIKYKLNSFLNHLGKNVESGHYQAYVRHPTFQSVWLNFDDNYVTELNIGHTQNFFNKFHEYETPYMLFYQKI